jgi:PAS domain-containing protein
MRIRTAKTQPVAEREASLLKTLAQNEGAQAREHALRDLLAAITNASLCYINGRQNVRHVYGRILEDILALTESQYGLIGEVLFDSGIPYVGEHFLTSTCWDPAAQARYDTGHKEHLLFRNIDSLFSVAVTDREVTIVNNAASDLRSGTSPFGHPPVDTFLGIPICNGLEIVGIIGIANREGGYTKEIADYLKPIVAACANLTVAWRIEQRNRVVERELAEANCMMRALVDRTTSAVLYENADRRLMFANDRFTELFGIEAAPAQLAGLDASMIATHSATLFPSPSRFMNRIEDLIGGEESYYGEMIEMTDGRLLLRDFVVVRSAQSLSGFFWHYREAMTPFDR